jgi:hypothetical protein
VGLHCRVNGAGWRAAYEGSIFIVTGRKIGWGGGGVVCSWFEALCHKTGGSGFHSR